MSAFAAESAGNLRRLAGALATGQISGVVTRFDIQRVCACLETTTEEVLRLSAEGMSTGHLSVVLSLAADVAEARVGQCAADLVWTGPELPGAASRDTSVVVRELWAQAERDVIVSTFVVQSIETVFEPLAARMTERPDLRVRIFLHIGRTLRDTVLDAELVREFTDTFRRHWPGTRLPELYYDPRGLSTDPATRATWHAKCVVIDDELSFVTSANFTQWAQDRNVEAGVLIRSRTFTAQLRQQFEATLRGGVVTRVPL